MSLPGARHQYKLREKRREQMAKARKERAEKQRLKAMAEAQSGQKRFIKKSGKRKGQLPDWWEE